jgi:hypothetical protein
VGFEVREVSSYRALKKDNKMSFQIQGCAGVAGASVALTGTSTATVTADNWGNYLFTNVSAGSYTVTPTLSGYTFNPASHSVTITASNVNGINFVASSGSTATSVMDSRLNPNTPVDNQNTQLYVIPSVDSRLAGPPVDDRINVPQDSRVSKPTNSRDTVGE